MSDLVIEITECQYCKIKFEERKLKWNDYNINVHLKSCALKAEKNKKNKKDTPTPKLSNFFFKSNNILNIVIVTCIH